MSGEGEEMLLKGMAGEGRMGSEKGGIRERTKAFALSVLRLFPLLAKREETRMLGRQLIRSGTSVGAHIREGKRARSDAEMISKIESGLQEMEETVYWLELVEEYDMVEKGKLSAIRAEAEGIDGHDGGQRQDA
jgi:four helix bundle protein